jgi:hypothetical protein
MSMQLLLVACSFYLCATSVLQVDFQIDLKYLDGYINWNTPTLYAEFVRKDSSTYESCTELKNDVLVSIISANLCFELFSSFALIQGNCNSPKTCFLRGFDYKSIHWFLMNVNRWKKVKFGFWWKMYYLCSTYIERPFEAALFFCIYLKIRCSFL